MKEKIEDLLAYTEQNDKKVIDSKTFRNICESYDLQNKRVLDIGCGFGSHMQRFGENSVGITTNTDEVEVGKVINRDIRLGNVETLQRTLPSNEKFDVIWCNNIFEHLLSPHSFLVNLKPYADESTLIILGTPMVPTPASLMRLKKFRGALASPHINFFTKETYNLTVKYAGWSPLKISPFKFKLELLNSITSKSWPHLYLVAKNNTNYTYPPKKMKEWEDADLYQPLIQIMNRSK